MLFELPVDRWRFTFCLRLRGAKIIVGNKKRLITFIFVDKPEDNSTEIKNGDQVEILTSQNSFPDPKWINTCITGKAKSAIRRFIRIRN